MICKTCRQIRGETKLGFRNAQTTILPPQTDPVDQFSSYRQSQDCQRSRMASAASNSSVFPRHEATIRTSRRNRTRRSFTAPSKAMPNCCLGQRPADRQQTWRLSHHGSHRGSAFASPSLSARPEKEPTPPASWGQPTVFPAAAGIHKYHKSAPPLEM